MSEDNLDYSVFEYPQPSNLIGDGKAVEAILKKYSTGQCRPHRYRICKILREMATTKFGFKPFCEYSQDEWLQIINQIEALKAGVRRKRQYSVIIKKILGYYIWEKDRPYQQIANELLTALFPSSGGYTPVTFTPTGEKPRIKQPIPKDIIVDILSQLRTNNIDRYMECAGFLFGASRISAWLNVTDENIDYENFTVDVTSKRTVVNETGQNTIYLVEPFVRELKLFFIDRKIWNQNQQNLPVYHIEKWQESPPLTYLTDKQVRKNFKKIFGFDFHPQSGRFTTSGLWQSMGMPFPFRQKLMNHSIKNTTLDYYSPLLDDPHVLTVVTHVFFPFKSLWPRYDWDKWKIQLSKIEMYKKMMDEFQY